MMMMDWWLKIELSNLNRKFSKTNNKNSFCQNADSFWHFAKKKIHEAKVWRILKVHIFWDDFKKLTKSPIFEDMYLLFTTGDIFKNLRPFYRMCKYAFFLHWKKKISTKNLKKNSFWKKRFDFKLIAKSRVNFMFSV